MILDLEPYQAPLPYPEIRQVRPDSALLATIMSGYSGAVSEMTTVLQYAQHSLRCKRRYGELSKLMRGIFYVETIHMELLGDCICKLGGDAQYLVSLEGKSVCWQSQLVVYSNQPAEMLLADLEGERQAVTYYEQSAAGCTQPEIKQLFLRLAEDERLHVRLLSDIHTRMFRKR